VGAARYFFSNSFATSFRSWRMGRCCGQTVSHLPHSRQSDAFRPGAVWTAPVVIKLLGVHNGEQIRNGDVLGTAIRAAAAGRTEDEVLAAENLLHVPDGCQLRFLKRESVSFHFSSLSSLYINSDKLSTFLKRH